MTYICQAAGWMPPNKATQLWSRYALSGLCPLRSDLLEKLRPLVGELHCEIVILLVERISLLGADPLNYEILRIAQNDSSRHSVGCRIASMMRFFTLFLRHESLSAI